MTICQAVFSLFFAGPGPAQEKGGLLLLRHGFTYFPPDGFGSQGRPVEAQVLIVIFIYLRFTFPIFQRLHLHIILI